MKLSKKYNILKNIFIISMIINIIILFLFFILPISIILCNIFIFTLLIYFINIIVLSIFTYINKHKINPYE